MSTTTSNSSDLATFGGQDGGWMAVETKVGRIVARVAVDPALRQGQASLPHGFGQVFDLPTGQATVGPRLNVLTDCDDCDPLTGHARNRGRDRRNGTTARIDCRNCVMISEIVEIREGLRKSASLVNGCTLLRFCIPAFLEVPGHEQRAILGAKRGQRGCLRFIERRVG